MQQTLSTYIKEVMTDKLAAYETYPATPTSFIMRTAVTQALAYAIALWGDLELDHPDNNYNLLWD